MTIDNEHENFMFLNVGLNHSLSYGVFRILLQLNDKEIINCV